MSQVSFIHFYIMKPLPRVGISYSWNEENPNHKKKVESLAQKLIDCGINVSADFYDDEPTHDLYYFMEELIHKTDYLLFICESSSKFKADGYQGQLGGERSASTSSVVE